MRALALSLILLTSCAHMPGPEESPPSVAEIADDLDKALNTADAVLAPAKASVELACDLKEMGECARAKAFLADAQSTVAFARAEVSRYRKASDAFWAASRAVKSALESVHTFLDAADLVDGSP